MLLNRNYPEVKGSLFYNYTSLANSPALRSLIRGVYDRLDGKTVQVPLKVSWPSKDITTSYTKYYLTGASDPSKPLYINGKLVIPLTQGIFRSAGRSAEWRQYIRIHTGRRICDTHHHQVRRLLHRGEDEQG